MQIVGLDWAVKPSDRAAVVLSAHAGALAVENVVSPVTNETAIELSTAEENDIVAVDIPFAWPRKFATFVANWSASGAACDPPPASDQFRYRQTDRFVHEKTSKWPLSVSTNLFSLGAREWATTVHERNLSRQIVVGETDASRVGNPQIIEVYPGATLKIFESDASLDIRGTSTRVREADGEEKKYSYKSDELTRRNLVNAVVNSFEIRVDDDSLNEIVSTGKKDHATDGLLAALSGLIYAGSMEGWGTWFPNESQIDDARTEGWIFFPKKNEPNSAR